MDRASYSDEDGRSNAAQEVPEGLSENPVKATIDPRLSGVSADDLRELSVGLRHRFGNGPPDPDDVAQEAYRRVLERDDLSSIRNMKAFLWRTARNLVLDAMNSASSRSKYDFEVEHMFFPLKGDVSSPETVIIARQQLKTINDLLHTMPKTRRRAFLLHRIDRQSKTEIARRLNISRSMVHKHIAVASAQIHTLFADDSEG
ncbi:MAG: sigma-70 family RNA polymerase sigma factor [Pseudomonadota bacterium]